MSDENLKSSTQEWHRRHPIFLTAEDMAVGKEELIRRARGDLSMLRGQLDDIRHGFGWGDRIEIAEHGITLVIAYLYNVLEDMRHAEKAEGE